MPDFDRSSALVGLATVVAANFLYLSGLPALLDPMMSMDPLYIRLARGSVASILSHDPGWGPLYILWLKPLVAMFGDPIAVYAANVYALSLAVSVALYVHLLLLTRRAAPAAGAALFFVASDFNVPLSSKVSGFALLVVLVGVMVSRLAASGARRWAVAAGGVLLASYARPELYAAALCLGAMALWLAYTEPDRSGRGLVSVGLLLAFVIPAVSIGVPIFGGDRFLIAFREHFAWSWSRWHGEGQTFLGIWQQAFGNADTIFQAVVANPGAVAHHLFDNLLGTAAFMVHSAFAHYPFLAPANAPTLVGAENVLVTASALGVLAYAIGAGDLRRRLRSGYGDTLACYAVIMAVSLGSATVIYPVAHYLVIPSVLLLATAVLAAAAMTPPHFGASWGWRLGGALLCLLAIPKPFVLPSLYEVTGSPFKGRITVARRVVDTIELVRSLDLPRPVNVLTTTDGIGELLGEGFHEIKVWRKGAQPLQAFMQENDVGVIINLEGGRDSFTVDDPHWKLIHDHTARAGFAQVPVPNHERVRVYVRADLMPR